MKLLTTYILLLCLILIVYNNPLLAQQRQPMSYNSSISQDERENINVYKAASAAVVTIKSSVGSGAGCIIDSSGIVITNKHVIASSYAIYVSLADGSTYDASILDVDNDDLAILKINTNRQFPYINLADSSKVEVGQRVLAIGNPFGLERTLTTGIISRIDYKLNRIQTDAAINPGNSGGPLLNTNGELIGINQAILNPSGHSSAGIGFAIPSNTVKRLLVMSRNARILAGPANYSSGSKFQSGNKFPSIVYKNKVFLGLSGVNMPNNTVVVAGIVPGSPADGAGLKFKDIIFAVDTTKIKKFDDIGFALKDKSPGDRVNLLYIRNGVVNSSSAILVPRS